MIPQPYPVEPPPGAGGWLERRSDVPDHKTIADFRRDNAVAIRKTCAQFIELCCRIGVLKGDCVAIDGSKFKAFNNRDCNFTKGKIASRLAHLEADVQRSINEMVRIDRQEESEARAEKMAHLARRYDMLAGAVRRGAREIILHATSGNDPAKPTSSSSALTSAWSAAFSCEDPNELYATMAGQVVEPSSHGGR
ncbi:hypothetical protein CESP606_16950 [Cereibacter sphaeroides]